MHAHRRQLSRLSCVSQTAMTPVTRIADLIEDGSLHRLWSNPPAKFARPRKLMRLLWVGR